MTEKKEIVSKEDTFEPVAKLHSEPNLRFFRWVRFFAKCLWPIGYVTLQKIEPTKKSSNFAREASFATGSFDQLEIRVGRVLEVLEEPSAPKKAHKMKIDFGKFGIKTSVGRFTQHPAEELKGKLVLGVLNFPPRQVGDVMSEVLTLGVQYPKAESGEATFIKPCAEAKIGGKLF